MAQGASVPVVLFPRYTTYAGEEPFLTIAMDLTKYPAVPFKDRGEKPAE